MSNIFEFLKDKPREEKVAMAKEMWPNTNDKTRDVGISKLTLGKFKTVRIKWVRIICDRFGIDPNTLFGYPWRKKVIIRKKRQ